MGRYLAKYRHGAHRLPSAGQNGGSLCFLRLFDPAFEWASSERLGTTQDLKPAC